MDGQCLSQSGRVAGEVAARRAIRIPNYDATSAGPSIAQWLVQADIAGPNADPSELLIVNLRRLVTGAAGTYTADALLFGFYVISDRYL